MCDKSALKRTNKGLKAVSELYQGLKFKNKKSRRKAEKYPVKSWATGGNTRIKRKSP